MGKNLNIPADAPADDDLLQPSFIGRHREGTPEQLKQRLREILAARNFYSLNFDDAWLEKIFRAYQQPHRFFHTLEHLHAICDSVNVTVADDCLAARLLLTGLFHDLVWFPQKRDNEERSSEAFDFLAPGLGHNLTPELAAEIRNAILATKDQRQDSELATRFHEFDCQVIINGDPVDLLGYEFQIFREYQGLNMTEYRRGRSAFFRRFARHYPQCRQTMRFLIEYLERRRPRVGIYAGTFNPFHIGHLSILEKAERMFDKVIVSVGVNPQKQPRPRNSQILEALPFHEVIWFDGLMVDLLEQESQFSDVTLVRGLRNGYDLDYEMNQLCFMQKMRPNTHAIYIPCDKELEHVSSSSLNSLRQFDVRKRDSIYYPTKYAYYRQSLTEMFA